MRTRPGPGELLDRRPGELGERPQSSTSNQGCGYRSRYHQNHVRVIRVLEICCGGSGLISHSLHACADTGAINRGYPPDPAATLHRRGGDLQGRAVSFPLRPARVPRELFRRWPCRIVPLLRSSRPRSGVAARRPSGGTTDGNAAGSMAGRPGPIVRVVDFLIASRGIGITPGIDVLPRARRLRFVVDGHAAGHSSGRR